MIDFKDLENPGDLAGATISDEARAKGLDRAVTKAAEILPTYAPAKITEPCNKCRGSGRFVSYAGRTVGPCFSCKGTGIKTFVNPKERRDAIRAKAAENAVKKGELAWTLFANKEPEVAAWILDAAPTFEFAASMAEAVKKFGSLTEKQLAACKSAISKRAAARVASVERVTNAPAISVERIEVAFKAAAGSGLKTPKLRLAGFVFSPAKVTSPNAGSLYVKSNGGEYLGKITAGKFIASRECGAERMAAVIAAASDPAKAAVAYGRMTGNCACCGRELTDPVSVARGIGPICAGKYGWLMEGEND